MPESALVIFLCQVFWNSGIGKFWCPWLDSIKLLECASIPVVIYFHFLFALMKIIGHYWKLGDLFQPQVQSWDRCCWQTAPGAILWIHSSDSPSFKKTGSPYRLACSWDWWGLCPFPSVDRSSFLFILMVFGMLSWFLFGLWSLAMSAVCFLSPLGASCSALLVTRHHLLPLSHLHSPVQQTCSSAVFLLLARLLLWHTLLVLYFPGLLSLSRDVLSQPSCSVNPQFAHPYLSTLWLFPLLSSSFVASCCFDSWCISSESSVKEDFVCTQSSSRSHSRILLFQSCCFQPFLWSLLFFGSPSLLLQLPPLTPLQSSSDCCIIHRLPVFIACLAFYQINLCPLIRLGWALN